MNNILEFNLSRLTKFICRVKTKANKIKVLRKKIVSPC